MAFTNQSLKPIMGTMGDGVVKLDFSFQMNGAASPVSTSGKGIASVTRTGTGAYTVVLTGSYIQLLSGQVSVGSFNGTTVDIAKIQNESAALRLGTSTSAGVSVSTIKILCLDDAGNAAEEAAATNTWVNATLSLSLSSLNT